MASISFLISAVSAGCFGFSTMVHSLAWGTGHTIAPWGPGETFFGPMSVEAEVKRQASCPKLQPRSWRQIAAGRHGWVALSRRCGDPARLADSAWSPVRL